MSSLAELRTKITANWPTNFHSDEIDSTKKDVFINEAQRWVCRGALFLPTGEKIKHNFSFLETENQGSTVDLQRRYLLPTEDAPNNIRKFKVEISCELINSESYRVPLTRLFKQDIEDRPKFVNTEDAGTPSHYCIQENDLWLFKLPDHSCNDDTAWIINLEYFGYFLTLSADGDNNILTNDWPEVIEWYATALGFRFGFDAEKAEYYEAKAKELLLSMILEDQNKALTGIEEGQKPAQGQSLAYYGR